MTEGDGEQATRWLVIDAVVVLTLVGLALRLYGIDTRGAWWDEAGVWQSALSGVPQPQEAPLFGWWVKLVMVVMGRDDSRGFHMGGVLCGAATIPAAYFLGRRVAGAAGGVVAAFLVSFAPPLLYFSQEAKPYSLLTLLTVLQIEAMLRLAEEWSWGRLVWLAALIIGVLTTHLVGVGMTGGVGLTLGLTLVWRLIRGPERRVMLVRLAISVGVLSAACLVGLAWTFRRPTLTTVVQTRYQYTVNDFFVYLYDSMVHYHHSGTTDFTRKLYLALAAVGLVGLLVRRRLAALAGLLLPCAAILTGLFLHLGEMSGWPWFRYASPVTVPFLVLVAAGASALPSLRVTTLFAGTLAAAWYADPEGLRNWYADAPVNRGFQYEAHTDDVKRHANQLTGVIFIHQNSVFGDETDRLIASYVLRRKDDLPVYYAIQGPKLMYPVELRHVAGNIPVPIRHVKDSDIIKKLPAGSYALFFGWDNFIGCHEVLPQLVEIYTFKPSTFVLCGTRSK